MPGESTSWRRWIGAWLRWPVKWLLRVSAFRTRFVFELVQNHYAALQVSVPIGNGMKCPFSTLEHWVSYENVFVEREYDELLDAMPLPTRWIDLGCHAGHFSLLLAQRHAKAGTLDGWTALLVDADARTIPAVELLISCNGWEDGRVKFLRGAIAEGGSEVNFHAGPYMTSSMYVGTKASEVVRRVSEEEVEAALPPPCDLIKVDIEGGEYPFLRAYQRLIRGASWLLLEWHSWQPGGGGRGQIVSMAEELGFRLVGERHAERAVPLSGGEGMAGLLLFKNQTSQ